MLKSVYIISKLSQRTQHLKSFTFCKENFPKYVRMLLQFKSTKDPKVSK